MPGLDRTRKSNNFNYAYSEKLANRIRERLAPLPNIEEREMMGGLTFMYNDKMCVGIIKDELMCRIDPNLHETAISKASWRTMDFMKRPMKNPAFNRVDIDGRNYCGGLYYF